MSDEFDHIRTRLRNTPPPMPGRSGRARALGAALSAFDAAEENARADQGSAAATRLKGNQSGLMAPLRRIFDMLTLTRPRAWMLGGASLAVMVIAVISSEQLREGGSLWTVRGMRSDAPLATAPQLRREAAEPEIVADEFRAIANIPDETAAGAQRKRSVNEAPLEEAEGDIVQRVAPSPQALSEAVAPTPASPAPALGRAIMQGNAGAALNSVPADAPDLQPVPGYREQGRDRFEEVEPNAVKLTAEEPVSTFSIDVDTASYAFMRRSLMNGVLPPKDSVRVEELINYFPYDYPLPESRETPFRADVALMPTPWNAETRLLRIGIKGYQIAPEERPRANLVFLIDTSGSMNAPDKLPLLVNAFRLLVDQLGPEDSVAIVTYAGFAGTVLEPTPASETAKILAALDRLSSGGSTAGGEGLRQAYRLAEQTFDADAVNRVMLATDGDFNVGISSTEELKGFIERKRESGIFLSVLGFGQGNLNDALMQALAQNGNGQAAHIDTLSEARKVLIEEAGSTLFPIAKDVKVQVEFNPTAVAEYRLIGYETRQLRREDFNNDRVDAGEIGAGHSVTALYEITAPEAAQVDPLRYGAPAPTPSKRADEIAFLKIRYKRPDEDRSALITRPVTEADAIDATETGAAVREARFAAAVAGFGQLLRGGRHTGTFGYDDVVDLASGAKGEDPFGYRAEFVTLVRLAKTAAALEPQRR